MQINKNGYIETKNNRQIDKTSFLSRIKTKPVDFMTDEELQNLPHGSVMVFDVECYINFFYVAFKSLHNGKYVAFEQSAAVQLDTTKLSWVMWRFCIVGFNSIHYDVPMISLALKGFSCEKLKEVSDFIIQGNNKVFAVEKEYGFQVQKYNHVDLIEVAPLQGSLKLYGGRMHCETMQDLPLPPEHVLTAEEAAIVRPYCCNDLDNTELLFNELAPGIKLRTDMSQQYGVDLRSKSDAQIAETVICNELKKVLGYYPPKPKFDPNLVLQYDVPDFIKFDSPQLQNVLDIVKNSLFYLDGNGSPIMPEELGKLKVEIGKSVYKLGMGGLHSQEKSIAHVVDDETNLRDNDVASYYPRIILNQGLFPPHLGDAFLKVYNNIVETRLKAKADGNKTVANSLKIVINGSFGKLGNKYSRLYAPQLMLQVTLTGQLALLMLIEMQEKAGISVVSGNTDGVISKYPKVRHDEVRAIIDEWEKITNFKTEETVYTATYSRDVNTYVAIKEKGNPDAQFLDDRLGCKTKGGYCERGSALNSILSKNPEALICSDALISYLKNRTPVEETIKNCKDIRRFITVRNVRGGGEKDGEYLGKVVRFYQAKGEFSCIRYVGSGNKVSNSEGAKPLMDLPIELPTDINYDWYIEKTIKMLYECGARKKMETPTLFF